METILLSFDEWAEVQDRSWIREATEDEIEKVKGERALGDSRVGGRDDEADEREWGNLFVDHNGRPYRAVTILDQAPGHIWRQATGHLRIFRFREEG